MNGRECGCKSRQVAGFTPRPANEVLLTARPIIVERVIYSLQQRRW